MKTFEESDLERCRYLRRDGERCTAEVYNEAAEVLLCGKHAARVQSDFNRLLTEAANDGFTLEEIAERERKLHLDPSARAVIYYIGVADEIKIGTTTSFRGRMSAFANFPHTLLAAEPGWYELESLRHRQFSHLRRDGTEWFKAEDDLLALVTQIRATHGDPQRVAEQRMNGDLADAPPTTLPNVDQMVYLARKNFLAKLGGRG